MKLIIRRSGASLRGSKLSDWQPFAGSPGAPSRRRPVFVPRTRLRLLAGVAAAAFFILSAPGMNAAPAQGSGAVTDLPDQYDLTTQVDGLSGAGAVRVAFDSPAVGSGYLLTASANKLALARLSHGASAPLGAVEGTGIQDTPGRPLKITIERRSGRIQVLGDACLLLGVEDNTFSGGSARVSAVGGAHASDLKEQPIDQIFFDDNFMRQADVAGEWTYNRGSWRIQTVGVVARGANPFSLESTPGPDALATTGYPFWSDYSFECAAKGQDDTTIGICVDVQDDQNYYLLRWSAGPKGSLDLVRVLDGKQTVLGSRPGGFLPMLWYQLGVRTSGGRLIAEVDRQRVLNVEDSTFAQGKIGAYSAGSGNTVWFDSVMVRDSNLLYDTFGEQSRHHWQLVGDRAVEGDPNWQNYSITSEILGSKSPMGILIRYQDGNHFYAFTWNSGGSQLVEVLNGKRRVLDDSKIGVSAGAKHNIQAGADDGYIWAAVDGKRVVEAVSGDISSGRPGLQPAAWAGQGFASYVVEPMAASEPFDSLTAEFTNIQKHPEMGDWSGPLHAWEPVSFGSESGYWHKGELFGNSTISIPLIPRNLVDSQFAVLLNASSMGPSSGYALDYSMSKAAGINLVLYRQGVKVASAHVKDVPQAHEGPEGTTTPTLDIRRQGRFVYAGINSGIALVYGDPNPVDGYTLQQSLDYAADQGGHSRLGLIIRGSTPMDIPDIVVNNRHTYAETFHLAPVNWRPQSGTWEVTSRWSCQPGWTWYGGHDTGYATNWFKTPIEGDLSVDYYAGIMMSAESSSGYEAWRDLNCSFCADGVNLFSGYTLMIGGWNGSVSRLYRKGKVVAESDSFHFPPQGVAHRLWFDVHVTRQGGLVRVVVSYLDNAGLPQLYPLFDWTDPDPLPGGQVGFWTWNNGIMLARAVLCYQQKDESPVYDARPMWTAQLPADAPYPGASEAGLVSLSTTDHSVQVTLKPPSGREGSRAKD